MRILVTGGAGFIGSEFVRQKLDSDPTARITVLDKLTYSGVVANLAPVAEHPGHTFIRGDICDPDVVDQVTAGQDAVVHFAAESHVDRSIDGAGPFVRTNVMGTQVLLDAARRHGVGRFVHASTDEVYGSISEGSWTEGWPLAPNSPYPASKAGSDLLALAYHRTHGLDVVITRCSNNYGPYPLFITNLIDGKPGPPLRKRPQHPRLGARLRPLPGHRPGPARRQGEGRAAMTTSRPVTGARGLLGQDVPA